MKLSSKSAVLFDVRSSSSRTTRTTNDGTKGEDEFDFVLTSSAIDYRRVLELGLQPILVQERFSVTDSKGGALRFLGPFFKAWRWRRILLNEGIKSISCPPTIAAAPLMIASVLAGAKIHLIRLGGRE